MELFSLICFYSSSSSSSSSQARGALESNARLILQLSSRPCSQREEASDRKLVFKKDDSMMAQDRIKSGRSMSIEVISQSRDGLM